MALTFGGGTSHNASKSAPVGVDTLTTLTWIGWIYPTALTDARRIWSKRDAGPNGPSLFISGTGGDIGFVRDHATTNTIYITSNTPIVTLNKWYCVAVVFNTGAGAGEFVQIYVGDLTTPMTECTYGTATDGTGALNNDAGVGTTYFLANSNGTALSFPGRIAVAAIHNQVHSLGSLLRWQWRPFLMSGCKGFHVCGYNGTTNVPDWSGTGNTLTIDGGTLSAHVPLGPIFGADTIGALGATATPKISTLQTQFPGTSLPSPFVDGSGGGSATVASNRLALSSGDAGGEDAAIDTGATVYDLDESAIYFSVTPSLLADFVMTVKDAGDNGYQISVGVAGNWIVRRIDADTPTDIFSVAYNATTMKWWRIRETIEEVHFETAPAAGNGPGSFTDQFSEDTDTTAAFDHTAVPVSLVNAYVATANSISYVEAINMAAAGGSHVRLIQLGRLLGGPLGLCD